MNTAVLSFILSISGFIVIFLLGSLGFFVRKLISSVDQLKDAVNEMKVIVSVHNSRITAFQAQLEYNHNSLTERLNNYSKRIVANEKALEVLKSKFNEKN